MNLEDICDRVRQLTHVRSAALLPDETIVEAVNEYSGYLFDTYDWPQVVRSVDVEVSGDSGDTYPLPSGTTAVLSVTQVTETSRRVLHELPLSQVLSYEPSQGTARAYAVDVSGGELVLFPAPTAPQTLSIQVKADPEPLSDPSDVPPMPEKFHMAWVYAAALFVLQEKGASPQLLAAYGQRLASLEKRMREQFLFSSSTTATRFGRKW